MALLLTVIAFFTVTSAQNCASNVWNVDYSSEKCYKPNNNLFRLECSQKNAGLCGTRLSSKARLGKGNFDLFSCKSVIRFILIVLHYL